jgi:hypothetical protein
VLKEVMETVEAMAELLYGPRRKREKRRTAKSKRGSDNADGSAKEAR